MRSVGIRFRRFFRLLLFASHPGFAARPAWLVRAVAAARAAAIPALQMVAACEDYEIAFIVKILIFDRLVHCDRFISFSLVDARSYIIPDFHLFRYFCLFRTFLSLSVDGNLFFEAHLAVQMRIKSVLKCGC